MNKLKVGIVGAGIQGISNALFLQKKGFDVTIFDRENPGSPVASYGNAGHFSPYASLSLNRTDILLDVPAMLMSSTGPLALKWNYVPKMIPWFLKFIMNTSKNKSQKNVSKNCGWNQEPEVMEDSRKRLYVTQRRGPALYVTQRRGRQGRHRTHICVRTSSLLTWL